MTIRRLPFGYLYRRRELSQSQDVFASLVEEIKSASEEIDVDDLNNRPLSLGSSNDEEVDVAVIKAAKKPASYGIPSTNKFRKIHAKRSKSSSRKVESDEGPAVAVGENLSLFNN